MAAPPTLHKPQNQKKCKVACERSENAANEKRAAPTRAHPKSMVEAIDIRRNWQISRLRPHPILKERDIAGRAIFTAIEINVVIKKPQPTKLKIASF